MIDFTGPGWSHDPRDNSFVMHGKRDDGSKVVVAKSSDLNYDISNGSLAVSDFDIAEVASQKLARGDYGETSAGLPRIVVVTSDFK